MNNKEIYQKTVGFSIRRLLWDIAAFLILAALAGAGYLLAEKLTNKGLVGLGIVAVLFFKHGKTLARNMGRVFGMGLASLVVIGVAFTSVFYLIASRFPAMFARLGAEVAEAAVRLEKTIPAGITEPNTLMWICAGIAGLILWGILHSAFVRPFVLVGVLRNYIESGIQEVPSEASFAMLDGKSAKFKKLHAELA